MTASLGSLRSRRLGARIAAAVLIAAAVALIVTLAIRIPVWVRATESIADPKERITLQNELIKTAAQVLGGIFLVSGVYFTWQNLLLTRDGQITDRFNQAVEHVGSDRLEIRLGGVYALARIARSSERDHWPAMQVLCARLRAATSDLASQHAPLPAEAQAILDVLGARSRQFEAPGQLLDFTRANLAGANLSGCHFEGARFQDADLHQVNFSRAHLAGASFAGADLVEASFRGADCTEANFLAANLQHATFRDGVLRKAVVFGANFEGTSLLGANLAGALFATREQFAKALTDDTTVMPEFSATPSETPQILPL
jgi:Pentapeptide repeats (8 copies)